MNLKKMTIRTAAAGALAVTALAAGCLSSGRGGEGAGASPHLDGLVRHAWKNIHHSGSRCVEFDYFPTGGMRTFYCHMLSFTDFRTFSGLVGVPIFRKGPHTDEGLVLDSPDSFGQYNPAFVARITKALIPGAGDRAFRAATQDAYNEFVAPLARIFFVTRQKLTKNPGYLAKESRAYMALVKAGRLPRDHYEKYFYFMNPSFIEHENDENHLMDSGFDGGWDGNVVKTCVAFWIRRHIDGSFEEFSRGLDLLLETYDRPFFTYGSGANPDSDRETNGF